jgi:hypothetical protein
VAGRTGSTTACDTVEQLWTALTSFHVTTPDGAARLAEHLGGALPASSALADRVLRTGVTVLLHPGDDAPAI